MLPSLPPKNSGDLIGVPPQRVGGGTQHPAAVRGVVGVPERPRRPPPLENDLLRTQPLFLSAVVGFDRGFSLPPGWWRRPAEERSTRLPLADGGAPTRADHLAAGEFVGSPPGCAETGTSSSPRPVLFWLRPTPLAAPFSAAGSPLAGFDARWRLSPVASTPVPPLPLPVPPSPPPSPSSRSERAEEDDDVDGAEEDKEEEEEEENGIPKRKGRSSSNLACSSSSGTAELDSRTADNLSANTTTCKAEREKSNRLLGGTISVQEAMHVIPE